MSTQSIQIKSNEFIPFKAIEDIDHIDSNGKSYIRIEYTNNQNDYHSMVIPSSNPLYQSLKKFVRA